MLESVIETRKRSSLYPGLAQSRVVVTALHTREGAVIAEAFARLGARLVLQAPDDTATVAAAAGRLSKLASGVHLVTASLDDRAETLRFAQSATSTLGGVDVAINVIEVGKDRGELERALSARIASARDFTRVIANRMSLTWRDGLILHVLSCPEGTDPLIRGIARSMLAALVRIEAGRAAPAAIRVNALVPLLDAADTADTCNEPCIRSLAELALDIASNRQDLAGLVFEASRD